MLAELLAASAAEAALGGSAFRAIACSSLQILRAFQGKRVPMWLQTHRAAELFEEARSHLEYPPVAEVMREYAEESLDAQGLAWLLDQVAAGDVRITYRACESPSPFAHGVLIGDKFSDPSLGRDRRAYLLRLHRQVLQDVLSEEQMAQLLDPRAIEGLERRLSHRSEATRARTAEELAQAIRELGDVPARLNAIAAITDGDPTPLLAALLREGRLVAVRLPDCDVDPERLVVADLWRQVHDAHAHHGRGPAPLRAAIVDDELLVGEALDPERAIPEAWRRPMAQAEARRAVLERYLRGRGPVTPYEAANATGWPAQVVTEALDALVAEGIAARGVYTAAKARPQWVHRVNLEEIHRGTLSFLKRELESCQPYEVVDFVTRWQHVHPQTRLRGVEGLRQVIAQLQGCEVMQGALETEVLASRVADYRPEMLDQLVASGEVRWARVGPTRMKRGSVALCLRRDLEWLGRGEAATLNGERQADVDIRAEILAVRDYLQREGSAFFDDIVAATGVPEGPATRAVWHLAWCGEATCETYACLRHADFQTSLSACYDLDSTPRKIVQGRMSAERVLKQMARRKLDPRLGRWVATPRLASPAAPLPEREVFERWAALLLQRWGVVTRDIVATEQGAPSWGDLMPAFKRMELMGQISRGYFVEGHHGEQFGLPEAIELLRDCRARRGDGQALGYLPDEPVFAMTNREPANLYASCFEIVDDRGQELRRGARSGNTTIPLVVQAGQVLLYRDTLLTTLTRDQLKKVILKRQFDPTGRPAEASFAGWNGHPVDVSPAAPLLRHMGFALDTHRHFVWPPKKAPEASDDPVPETFLPYYETKAAADYGPDFIVERARDAIRPALRALLDVLVPAIGDRWRAGWNERWTAINYRKGGRIQLHIAASFVDVRIQGGTRVIDGKKRRYWKHVRVAIPADVATIAPDLPTWVREAEQWTDLAFEEGTQR